MQLAHASKEIPCWGFALYPEYGRLGNRSGFQLKLRASLFVVRLLPRLQPTPHVLVPRLNFLGYGSGLGRGILEGRSAKDALGKSAAVREGINLYAVCRGALPRSAHNPGMSP